MKKSTLFAGVIAMAISFTSSVAMAGSDDYAVINKLGMDITHLYLSPNNDDNWGEDILGRDVLEDGDECGIEFDPDDTECAYDIKIIDDKGKAWTVTNIDLCKWHKVTFKRQGNKVMWSAK
jgi:hypothetical protein